MTFIIRDGAGCYVADGPTRRCAWLAARREWLTRYTAYLGHRIEVPQLRAWRRDVAVPLGWTCAAWSAATWPDIAG